MVYVLRVTNGSALKLLNHYSFVIGLSLIKHSIKFPTFDQLTQLTALSKVLFNASLRSNKPISKPTMM